MDHGAAAGVLHDPLDRRRAERDVGHRHLHAGELLCHRGGFAQSKTLTWTPTGTGSEIYNPRTGAWSAGPSTLVQLWDSAAACGGANAATQELGPAVLRPDGTVFYAGANQNAAAHTAIFNSRSGYWAAGPDFPNYLGSADRPAALEPNGKVLIMARPGAFESPVTSLEWKRNSLTEAPATPNAPNDSSYYVNMLVLPTGQILLTDFSNDVEIFTPTANREVTAELKPVIVYVPSVATHSGSYSNFGYRFNGASQGAAYGDNVQAATNYLLVRINNNNTGHIYHARTHDHSSMAVASDELVTTRFNVSKLREDGPSKLEDVANGIA